MTWIIENPDGSISEISASRPVHLSRMEPVRKQVKRRVSPSRKRESAGNEPEMVLLTYTWNSNDIFKWSAEEKAKWGIHFVDVPPIPYGYVEKGHSYQKNSDGTYSHIWDLVPISKEDLKTPLSLQAKSIRDSMLSRYEYIPSGSDQVYVVQTDATSLTKLHLRATALLSGKTDPISWVMYDNQSLIFSPTEFLDMIRKIDDHIDRVHHRYFSVRGKIKSGEVNSYDLVLAVMTQNEER